MEEMNMKKQYLPPEMLQVLFAATDILTISPADNSLGDVIDWNNKNEIKKL